MTSQKTPINGHVDASNFLDAERSRIKQSLGIRTRGQFTCEFDESAAPRPPVATAAPMPWRYGTLDDL
jgi:hypothetical protein